MQVKLEKNKWILLANDWLIEVNTVSFYLLSSVNISKYYLNIYLVNMVCF